jgi:hypothetical protein
MNKNIALFCLIISLGFTQIQAQDKSYLKIDFKKSKDIQIDNFKKFSFQDKNNNSKSGKIKILNDSQFCFVNYFLDPIGPVYNLKDIHKVFAQGSNGMKYKIPTAAAIGIALFIPGGIYFLIIREAVRQVKLKRNKQNGSLSGWVDESYFEAKIITNYPQV